MCKLGRQTVYLRTDFSGMYLSKIVACEHIDAASEVVDPRGRFVEFLLRKASKHTTIKYVHNVACVLHREKYSAHSGCSYRQASAQKDH